MKSLKNFLFIFFFVISGSLFGQIRIVNSTSISATPNSSAFIDASSNNANNSKTNIGKGLLYPRVDLTTFTAFSGSPTGIPNSYPTRFDGMVVYNSATGVSGIGNTTVNPGFYYYSNQSTNVNGGKWIRLNDGNTTSTPKGISFPDTTISNAGDVFYRTDLQNYFFYNGSDWVSTVQSPVGTTLPDVGTVSVGDTYFRTDNNSFYVFNNGAWHLINGLESTLANGMFYVGDESNVASPTLKTSIPISGFGEATNAVSMGSQMITNLANPVDSQDAATKQYVDASIGSTYKFSVSDDGVVAFNIPFVLKENSAIFYNGSLVEHNQWSGIGTTVINLNLDTKSYDNITIRQ